MIPYLIIFTSSVVFFYISGITKNKILKFLSVAIAILLPSILAGLRDYSIGTDVNLYGNIWFENACNANGYLEYVQYASWGSIGVGYATLNYIVAMFTNNAHWFYFLLNLITNLFIYFGLRRNKNVCSIPIGFMVYYFVFYCIFLNALRQSLAVAIIFWGFYFIQNDKFIKYVFTVIFASLFHSTALIAFALYVIHWLMNRKNRNLIKIMLVVSVTFVSLEFWNILEFLSKYGLISERYGAYLNSSSQGGGVIIRIIFYGTFCFLLYFFSNFPQNSQLENDFKVFNLISVLLSFLAIREAQSVRIVMYFDIYLIYYCPYVLRSNLIAKKDKIFFQFIIIILIVIYWIVVFGIRKSDQVVPYIFMRW